MLSTNLQQDIETKIICFSTYTEIYAAIFQALNSVIISMHRQTFQHLSNLWYYLHSFTPVLLGFTGQKECAPIPCLTMKNRWFSVDEIAEYLGVQPDTVYKWINRKDMPVHKVGRLWKFKTVEIDEWVRSGAAGDGRKRSSSENTDEPDIETGADT